MEHVSRRLARCFQGLAYPLLHRFVEPAFALAPSAPLAIACAAYPPALGEAGGDLLIAAEDEHLVPLQGDLAGREIEDHPHLAVLVTVQAGLLQLGDEVPVDGVLYALGARDPL